MPIETHIVVRASTKSPRITRKQHEKGSFLHVRAKNPSALTLVPCPLSAVDESGRHKYSITKTKKQAHLQMNHKKRTLQALIYDPP